jgi:hypothetical protein
MSMVVAEQRLRVSCDAFRWRIQRFGRGEGDSESGLERVRVVPAER